MRSLVIGLLAALPCDARSRRALDETLADWALETARARTIRDRVCICAQSLAGLMRALVLTTAHEVARIPGGWLVSRLLLLTAVPVLLLAATGWGHVRVRGAVAWGPWLQLAALTLPQATAALLPLALFAVIALRRRDHPLPALGLATIAAASVLAIGMWAIPIASRLFHEVAYAGQTNIGFAEAARRLPAGAPDLSPLPLVADAVQRPFGPSMAVLLFRTGLAFLAAVLVVLGSAAARLDAKARRACVTLVALTYSAGIALLPSEWELGGHASAPVGCIPWLAAGLALGLSEAIGRRQPAEGELP